MVRDQQGNRLVSARVTNPENQLQPFQINFLTSLINAQGSLPFNQGVHRAADKYATLISMAHLDRQPDRVWLYSCVDRGVG